MAFLLPIGLAVAGGYIGGVYGGIALAATLAGVGSAIGQQLAYGEVNWMAVGLSAIGGGYGAYIGGAGATSTWSLFATYAGKQAAIYAGIGASLGMAFSSPELPSPRVISPTYAGDEPVTTYREGTPVARAYGKCFMSGNIIRVNDKGDSRLKPILSWCLGPIKEVLGIKVNGVPFDDLNGTNYKALNTGTWQQTNIQVNGVALYSDKASAYRGIAHSGFNFEKNNQIGNSPVIQGVVNTKLCRDIAVGGVEAGRSFSRNPAQIMWDYYRDIEGKAITDLDENAFKALQTFCNVVDIDNSEGTYIRPVPDSDRINAPEHHIQEYDVVIGRIIGMYKTWTTYMTKEKSISGAAANNQWMTFMPGTPTNNGVRYNVDLGEDYRLKKIVIVNGHDDNADLEMGIQNFSIQGSNSLDSFDDSSYSVDTGWNDLATGLTAEQYDVDDPYQEFDMTETGTSYRYFSIKVENGYRDGNGPEEYYIGVRDIAFVVVTPRYTFDYVFDTDITENDAKKMMWQSFNGRVIRSQGKLKPVWEWNQEHDGSGGLQTKTVKHTFTTDNIVQGSFNYTKTERYNTFIVDYIDSNEDYKKASVIDSIESSVEDRGPITLTESSWFITNEDMARRRVKLKKRKTITLDFVCTLRGFPDSSDLEIFDLVEVTHPTPGWTTKQFLVIDKNGEDDFGRCTFVLESYNSGNYTDDEVAPQKNYLSSLPAKFESFLAPTDLALSDSSYFGKDGRYIPQIELTYTLPANSEFWSHAKIQILRESQSDQTIKNGHEIIGQNMIGGGTWEDYPIPDYSSGEGFVIDGEVAGFKQNENVYVRMIPVSIRGVKGATTQSKGIFIPLPDLEDLINNTTDDVFVILPEGDYFPVSEIPIPNYNITIKGESRNGVVIHSPLNDTLFRASGGTSLIFNDFAMENLSITKNGTSTITLMSISGKSGAIKNSTKNINLNGISFLGGNGNDFISLQRSEGKLRLINCDFNGYNCSLSGYDKIEIVSNTGQGSRAQQFLITDGNEKVSIHSNNFSFMRYGIFAKTTRIFINNNDIHTTEVDPSKSIIIGVYCTGGEIAIIGNSIEIDTPQNSYASFRGVYIYDSIKPNVSTNQKIRVNVNSNDANVCGVDFQETDEGTISSNKIEVTNVDTNNDVYGIRTTISSRNTIDVNTVKMGGHASKDVGIKLDIDSNDNKGTQNITIDVSVPVEDNGARNDVNALDSES